MAVKFAARMSGLKTSEVRELLKLTAAADLITFGGGLPPNECFPLADIARALARVIEQHGPRALQYSTTEGWPALRKAIAARMRRRLGVEIGEDEVLVTTGSQQGLDLTGKIFFDEGDVVFCENPTYLAAINAFRAYRPTFVAVPSDEHGMIVSDLAGRITGSEREKVIYVIPDFQNPSGRTWSLERRLELLEVAARFDLPVLEDSPYRELRFEGQEVPALFSLDRTGRVIFMSTFSKIFSPGLRVGWVAARAPFLDKYVLAKQGADLHTCTLAQALVATFMEMFDLEATIDAIRRECGVRRDAMVAAFAEHLPREVRVNRPAGGLFLWAELPEALSARDWLRHALAHGAAFPPGDAFFPNGGGANAARICFSDSPPSRIAEGVKRLAAALRKVHGAERLAWPETAAA
jgi:DNA-binding transcriptional MocR family regulator